MQVTVHAPAKINLTLDIVGVREDGYHLLESIFQAVSVYDTITVKTKWGKSITLVADGCDCPAEKNTAYKAAEAFFRYTGLKKGVKIIVEKHIPQQAGMGGGSADAAGVLWALNLLFGTCPSACWAAPHWLRASVRSCRFCLLCPIAISWWHSLMKAFPPRRLMPPWTMPSSPIAPIMPPLSPP